MSGNEEIAKTHTLFSQWKLLSLHANTVHLVPAAKINAFSPDSMSPMIGSEECYKKFNEL